MIKVLQKFSENTLGFKEHNCREGTDLQQSHKNKQAKLDQ